ncbi:CPBP family intramembrane glutamic endopeptidase [Brevibacillus dissolubilis]|uniref:CPBP family intramembrane glutamic endopeptidase n=1 Tax=Brevibacillus dissolubilis TaxID=1844116 RepID=UPI0021002D70|nr:CPBP family intramembrane glutamic endopeptidase [Brevibacillus dissolubilis]
MDDRLLELDERTLRLNLLLTQGILLLIATISAWLVHSWQGLLTELRPPAPHFVLTAVGISIGVVGLNLLMDRFLPKSWLEDGEINNRVFQGLSLGSTAGFCLLVGVAEELMFRGVVQVLLGNVWTSLLFTLIHFRYLKKPILVVSVFATSYVLGWLYDWSQSLLPSMVMHGLIDFFLALWIQRLSKLGIRQVK